jgi:hypothetical protein
MLYDSDGEELEPVTKGKLRCARRHCCGQRDRLGGSVLSIVLSIVAVGFLDTATGFWTTCEG